MYIGYLPIENADPQTFEELSDGTLQDKNYKYTVISQAPALEITKTKRTGEIEALLQQSPFKELLETKKWKLSAVPKGSNWEFTTDK